MDPSHIPCLLLRAGQGKGSSLNKGKPKRNLMAVRNCTESRVRPRPAIGGASSQPLACGIEQASIRLLLRALDLAINFPNLTSCCSLDKSCCAERGVDRSARSCAKLVASS